MTGLFTIGHSTHSWEEFLGLLRAHQIDAVADVRSNPYSARLPHFNREPLDRALRDAGIRYVFMGDELGARRSEHQCYVGGVARYDRIAQTAAFLAGLERIRSGCQRFRLALLCAEKDPLACHRAILVCRHLRSELEIRHILENGGVETHTVAEARLLAEERVPSEDFFASRHDLIARAYDQRADKIAFHECAEGVAHSEAHA
jgi:uncharacterized protein (DUF488 family)